MAEKKEYKVDLEKVIRENFSSFKEGDFSMLTDEETTAFLSYINYYIREFGNASGYFKEYELRDGDLAHEVFLWLVNNKLSTMELSDEYKATFQFRKQVRWCLNMIIDSRKTLIRKANYGENIYSLDDKIKIKANKTLVNYYMYSLSAKNCRKFWANKGLDVTTEKDRDIVENMAENEYFKLKAKVKRYRRQKEILEGNKKGKSKPQSIDISKETNGGEGR